MLQIVVTKRNKIFIFKYDIQSCMMVWWWWYDMSCHIIDLFFYYYNNNNVVVACCCCYIIFCIWLFVAVIFKILTEINVKFSFWFLDFIVFFFSRFSFLTCRQMSKIFFSMPRSYFSLRMLKYNSFPFYGNTMNHINIQTKKGALFSTFNQTYAYTCTHTNFLTV